MTFDEAIDQITDELEVLYDQKELIQDRNQALADFNVAKTELETIPQIQSSLTTGYVHNGGWVPVENLGSFSVPNAVDFYIENGVPNLSVQFFEGQQYQDIVSGGELDTGVYPNHATGNYESVIQKVDQVKSLFEQAVEKYEDWQDLYQQTGDIALSSVDNQITAKEKELEVLNAAYAEFIQSGLTPEEAGQASLAKLEQENTLAQIKIWGLRIGIAIAGLLALALLYTFLKKRGIIFKK